MTESGEITKTDLPPFAPRVEYLIEHLVIGAGGYAELADTLQKLSTVGWRLIAVSNGLHYFEREL